MTRIEKELKMIEALGLKVGDVIERNEPTHHFFKIVENDTGIWVINEGTGVQYYAVHFITFYDWKKVKPSLKNKKCKDFDHCIGCPIYKSNYLDCGNGEEETLEEKYNGVKQDLDKLKTEIYGEE